MGQSLNSLIYSGVFGNNVHFENGYFFTDTYTSSGNLSGIDAYDEMDLDNLLGESDILILEINEAAMGHPCWNFVEYLIQHPEYLDYNS